MKIILIQVLIYILLSNIVAQDNNKSSTSIFPTANSVLDSLEQNYNRIEDYYVHIEISIKTPILRMPRKRVNFWYKQPNLTKVKTKGFAAIPKSGIISSPIDIFDNLSDLTVIGAEYLDDKQVWILQGMLNPDSLSFKNMGKIDPQPNLTMQLYVDRNNWTLIKSETWMDTSKVIEVISEYELIKDDIYLPKETVISFEYSGGLPSGVEEAISEKKFGSMHDDSLENDLSGMITLKFSNYEVNRGIDESFFNEKEPE